MKIRLCVVFILLLIASVVLISGCGQSNAASKLIQVSEQNEKEVGSKSVDSETTIQSERSKVGRLSSNGTAGTQEASVIKSGIQDSSEKERTIWVIDTELERDMKTGSVTTWQHDCKVNSDGLVEEDQVVNTSGSIKILRYRYDSNGNCTWECRVDSAGNVDGRLREYDENNHVVIETTSYYMDEEEWQDIDQAFEQELLDVGEEIDQESVAEISARIALYKKYTMMDVFTIGGNLEKVYFFPSRIYQYVYDSSGRYLQAHRLEVNPDEDYVILYDYEDTTDGYNQICYIYRNGELNYRTVFYYDNNKREQKWEAVGLDGKRYQWRTNQYDSKGNVVERISHTEWGTSKTQYTYDANGNIVSEKNYDYSWNEAIPYKTYEYTYKPITVQR